MSRNLVAMVPMIAITNAMFLLGGCPMPSNDTRGLTPTGGEADELTLTHSGVDFSTGTAGDANTGDVENSDGDIIGWTPAPSNRVDSETEVWFRPSANTTTENFIADMGAVALDSVTTIPATWDGGPGQDLPALQEGHVYVVKCLDGYAKFLVTATRTDPDWAADVEYVFTSGTTFAE